MHARILTTILVLAMFISLHAAADTCYVSPTGNDTTGNGSPSAPYLSLTNAYQILCKHLGGGQIVLEPGTFDYEIATTIVLSNGLISIKGSSPEATILGPNTTLFIAYEPSSIAGLTVEGMVTNTACLYLSDAKLVQPCMGTNVVGVYRDDGSPDILQVRGLTLPSRKDSAVSKEYSDGLTNSLVLQGDQRYYKTGSPIVGSLMFGPTNEYNTVDNMSLQQVGLAACLWFPENGAFNVKERYTGGSGDRFSVQSQTIYAFRPLEMRGNCIQNVGEPQNSSDAATRNYVDQNCVNKTGGTMSGALTVPELNISGNCVIGGGSSTQLIAVNNESANSVAWSEGSTKQVNHNLGISGTYLVIITPRSNPGGAYYVSDVAANSFTVTSLGTAFNFDYLIIKK